MLILGVLGVEIRYVICLFIVMSAVTGRTHIDWRLSSTTALLRLSVIRKCGVRLGKVLHSLNRISLFTEVPSIDEPIPSVQVQSDKVESVVFEAPSAVASLSDFLYVTPGNRFEQLASTLLSKFQELSDRGLNPPVQSQSVLVSGSQPSLDRPSTSFVAATDQLGVAAPLEGIILPNPIDPVFRLSTSPVSSETPVHRLAAIDRKLQTLEQSIASTRQTINSFWDGGLRPHNPLWIRFCPSVRKGSLLLHLPNQALRSQKETCHSLAHLCLGDDHTTSHLASIPRIRPVAHFAQGVTLTPIEA